MDKDADIDSALPSPPKFINTNDARGASVISKVVNRGGKMICGFVGDKTCKENEAEIDVELTVISKLFVASETSGFPELAEMGTEN
jgi:hypothetical protein